MVMLNRIPKRFLSASFENFITTTSEEERLIESLKNIKDKNIIISGGVGLGKTHLCYALVNQFSEECDFGFKSDKVKITTIKGIIDAIRGCWDKDTLEHCFALVSEFKTAPVLIIDEIGVQYGTESEKIELFDIINYRYEEMLPTVCCSNLPKEQILKVLGRRIYDRLFGGADYFELTGKSKR